MPLFRFKRRVSVANAYGPRHGGARFDGRQIEAGAVTEEPPCFGYGVTPNDVERIPDPRDDGHPMTALDILSGCDRLLKWIHDIGCSLSFGVLRRVVYERLCEFVEAYVMMADTAPLSFEVEDLCVVRDVASLVNIAKRFRQTIVEGFQTESVGVSVQMKEAPKVVEGVNLHTESGTKRRVGRPTKSEKDSATKVLAALTAHHGYESGSVTEHAPASNRGLAAQFGLSPNALSRFLRSRFPHEHKPHKKYVAACHNGTIGSLLMLWNRELPGHLANLTAAESGHRDGE
jgi:hypothetical protein